MTVTTSYPGVYVQEDASPSISVSTLPTAVPVICLNAYAEFKNITRINSWMHFSAFKAFKSSDTGDVSVRTYFENGGGPCYVANAKELDKYLPLYSDISLIVAAGQDVSSVVSAFCKPGSGLFALLDVPTNTEITSGYKNTFASNPCAAAYYPWLTANWASTPIPPSAVMAGIYCTNDRSRGVWKAPANVPISADLTPQYKISDAIQGQFNTGCPINTIRTFEGQDAVVWGARTLEDSDNWRYIPVRRLFDSVERDLKNAMNRMMFEPNTPPTWEKVRTAITNYMHSLWRQGALQGATEKQAYFVQIGNGTTMTDDDIKQGKMIAKVGMAAVRPAEFIILQVTQDIERN
jgi:phage tail sheath protein FI